MAVWDQNAVVIFTSRMLGIVGEQEQVSYDQILISNGFVDALYIWIEDLMKVATITRAAKVQCWISYSVQPFTLAF